jgi:hypothetical protein
LLPHFHKSGHIAIERCQSLLRQNDILAIDLGQAVHLNRTSAAHRIDMSLQRDNASPVGLALAHQQFKVAE